MVLEPTYSLSVGEGMDTGYFFTKPAQSLTTLYKHLSLYPEISVVIMLYQINVILQQIETVTENCDQSKCIVVESRPSGDIYQTLPHLRLREPCGRRGGKIVRGRGSGSLL